MEDQDLDALERRLDELEGLEALRGAGPAGAALARVYSTTRELQDMLRPQITVEQPQITVEQPAAVVVPASEVRVDVPDQSEAIRVLAAAMSELVQVVAGLQLTVNVDAPVVNVEQPQGRRRVTFSRDRQGQITEAVVTDG